MRHKQTGEISPQASRILLPKLWARLGPILSANRGRVILALSCLLAAKGGLLVIPFLLKALVDGLDGDTGTVATGIIMAMVLAYGGARLANTLFGELRDTLFGRVTERAMHQIGLQVFRHVHSLDLDYHLNRRTGGLARDIERGTNGISFLMRFFIFNIAPTLFEIGMVAVILLLNYGASYTSVVVLSVVIYAWFSFKATGWRTRFVREVNEADSNSNTRAVDSLLNYETVKYFTNETFEAERYDQSLDQWEEARRKNRLSLFGLNAGQALIIAASQTVMLAMAAWDVLAANITLGDFVLINQFMLQLFMPLGFLGFVYREIKASLANIEKLFDVLDREPAVRDAPEATTLTISTRSGRGERVTPPAHEVAHSPDQSPHHPPHHPPDYPPHQSGAITFSNLSFGYSPERLVLDNLSFEIAGGQTVAIVGASGAGKSTVVKLLFRFYDPSDGCIRIDGQDIRSVTQHSLRQAIAIVPQDCVLFNDSLMENIRYGRPTASDAEVEAAVKAAHLSDFVSRIPDGLNTRVGERGLKLSGGERQRVAIARAVLKNAPILVFDEATSSLDSQSEQAVLGAFREIAGHHTALVIAHRLSTIIDADKIVVLHSGRVVEQGTHEELLAKGEHYSALWQAQQRQVNA